MKASAAMPVKGLRLPEETIAGRKRTADEAM
jgi:hypothetical protein